MKNRLTKLITLFVFNVILSSILFSSTVFATDVTVSNKITLNAVKIPNQNAVALQWLSQIQNVENYQYRIFQRPQYGTSFQPIPVMYNTQIKVLWIYMLNNIRYPNTIKSFVSQSGLEDSVTVDTVYYSDYNKNPASYLKDSQGNYKYHIMFFGAYELDGNRCYDLSESAKYETSGFLDAGRSVIFSHDTIRYGHPNYVELGRRYANIDVLSTAPNNARDTIGGRSVSLTDFPGILTSFPVQLPKTLNINLTHTSGQVLNNNNITWARFNDSSTWGNKDLRDSKNNFFLTTYNNTAMIQIGHTLGFTEDEQSILLNLFVYMGQLTSASPLIDLTAIDKNAPDKPSATIQGNMLMISSNDIGTSFDYYIEAVNQKSGNKVQSNTVSILNKSGLAGFIVTYDEEPGVRPSYGTLSNVPANTNSIPLDLKNRGKYANITAIDYSGNYSETAFVYVYSEEDPLNLTITNIGKNDGISLNWTNPDASENQKYRVFQSSNSVNFETMQTNYGDPIKVLHVYPISSRRNDMIYYVENYGPKNNLINVATVCLDDFNKTPSKYLSLNGQFIYDVIVFGFADYNGYANQRGDLSNIAKDEVEKFLKAGRGILLGHDTVAGVIHPNFNYLGEKYMGMNPASSYSSRAIGSVRVAPANTGALTQFPYNLNGELSIAPTHSSSQMISTKSKTWFKFAAPIGYGNRNLITDNSANFYLATSNNIGMIQTGHTHRAVEDEGKILINTLFYLSQLTSNTNYQDKTAKDLAAPSAPKVTVNEKNVSLESEDKGTTYEYYVESISQKSNNKIPSNRIPVVCTSGVKEYYVLEDNTNNSIPSQSSKVISAQNASYTLNGNSKYLHVIAVDYAGNKSEVTHIELQ